jgi:rod shape-determining protein MreB
MFNALRKTDLAVDLGTSKIAVFVRGEGLVLNEPACIAFRGEPDRADQVLAVGQEAAEMVGKTPRGVFVAQPIQDGVISDCRMASELLGTLLDRHGPRLRGGRRRQYLVGTLLGANSMERRSFEQVALAAGASDVRLVDEPLAAAVGAGLPIAEPLANMVVDVGGGATEAIVVSLKKLVSGGSIRIGGDAMDEAIRNYLHRKLGLDVGKREARRLKEVALAGITDRLLARGFDVRLRRPSVATISVGEIHAALRQPFTAIVEMVKDVVDGLPPELSADLMHQGITLTGGGATIESLRQKLADELKVEVRAVRGPEQAMIRGCGQMLDYV